MYLPRHQKLTPAGQIASIRKGVLTHNYNLAHFAKSVDKGLQEEKFLSQVSRTG
jgi:hypothetical protein